MEAKQIEALARVAKLARKRFVDISSPTQVEARPMRTCAVVLAMVAAAGCTRWSSNNVYGPEREVARRLLGAPAIAETKSSSLNAGFAGSARGGTAVAGLGASSESVTLKHCVQKAELTFEQPFDVRPQLRGRGWDVAGAVVLGLIGLGGIQAGMGDTNDPSGNNGTQNIVAGSAFIAAGAGLLIYSFGIVPNREPPVLQNQRRQWVENRLVESSGCGLPGDVAAAQAAMPVVIQAAPAQQDATARLQQLDKLRAAGSISEADYARKRKEIIDGI
jgi:hypothetical protein